MESGHRRDPGGEQLAKQVRSRGSDRHRPPNHNRKEREDQSGADKSELFTNRGKDKIGVLFGNKLKLGLRAMEESLAENTPAADRDARL